MAAGIHGVCPVLPTIFLPSEQIDFEGMSALLEAVLGWGVHGLVIFGIGSEFYKLADGERAQLLDFFLKAVRGRVRAIVSVTAHSTLLACRQAAEAEAAGADAIMLLPPFFAGPDGASLMRHLQAVVASVRIPVVVQYAPEETKLSISAQAFLQLAEQSGREMYVKVESKPAGPLISRLTEGGVKVLVGKGGIPFYEALERGAIGVMPGCSVADRFVRIYDLFLKGKKLEALAEHNRVLPYLCFVDQSTELFLASEKRFLNRRGLIAEVHGRRPHFELEEVHRRILDLYVAGLGYG
jgi:4-hydroxy-tetrahydrodipicolinate synthase